MTGRGQNEVRLRDQGTGIGMRLLLMTNRKSYIVFTLQIGTRLLLMMNRKSYVVF